MVSFPLPLKAINTHHLCKAIINHHHSKAISTQHLSMDINYHHSILLYIINLTTRFNTLSASLQ
jgi:hypothetical protein